MIVKLRGTVKLLFTKKKMNFTTNSGAARKFSASTASVRFPDLSKIDKEFEDHFYTSNPSNNNNNNNNTVNIESHERTANCNADLQNTQRHTHPLMISKIEEQTFYCKDSRGGEWNFGAPGGDFGEFLLALSSFMTTTTTTKTINITEIFEKWLNLQCSRERPFYLHSDRVAMDYIAKEMGIRGGLKCPSELMSSREEQEKFLKLITTDPNCHGCGHIRLILQEAKYEINKEALTGLLRAFFTKLWASDERILFKIYEEKPDGKGLVVVYGPDAVTDVSLCARQQVVLRDKTQQYFILNHHAVRNYRKSFLTPFFISQIGKDSESSSSSTSLSETMFNLMEEKGWRNAGFTAGVLARGKPIYRIELDGSELSETERPF